MTTLINQITINGQKTTFLNYVTPSNGGETILQTSPNWFSFFVNQLTSLRVAQGTTSRFNLRFNVPFESMTVQVVGSLNSTNSTSRFFLNMGAFQGAQVNTTSSNGVTQWAQATTGVYYQTSAYAVINDYACSIAMFGSSTRNTVPQIYCFGWAKDRQFAGNQFPRNFYIFGDRSDALPNCYRATTENSSNLSTQVSTTPSAINCVIATPGANASDIVLQDLSLPNWYFGKMWHVIRMPSSCLLGKIYKNSGVDPDTGIVETDQKAFWMCVGDWGSSKMGMRVWTEGII